MLYPYSEAISYLSISLHVTKTSLHHDVATSKIFFDQYVLWLYHISLPCQFERDWMKNMARRAKKRKNDVITSWRRNVKTFFRPIWFAAILYQFTMSIWTWLDEKPGQESQKTNWWRHYVMDSWRNFLRAWFFKIYIELRTF